MQSSFHLFVSFANTVNLEESAKHFPSKSLAKFGQGETITPSPIQGTTASNLSQFSPKNVKLIDIITLIE